MDGRKVGIDRSVHSAHKAGVLSKDVGRLGTEWSVPIFREFSRLRMMVDFPAFVDS